MCYLLLPTNLLSRRSTQSLDTARDEMLYLVFEAIK